MRNRLPLHLDSLALDEISYLEMELDHYREKFRGIYTVMATWTEVEIAPIVGMEDEAMLGGITWLQKLYRLGAAAGGGALMVFHPETSLFLFRDVHGAARSMEHLSEALSAFGGMKSESESLPWRFGVATGEDFLAEDSPRILRESLVARRALTLVQSANQGVALLDESTYRRWPHQETCRPVVRSDQTYWEYAPSYATIASPSQSESYLTEDMEKDESETPVQIEESRRNTW